jgi:hypothetical protein
MLNRSAILAVPTPAPLSVSVPEWGGEIALRQMSLADVITWSDIGRDPARRASGESTAMVVIACAVSAEGEPLFTADDMGWLLAQPGFTIQRIANAALEHSDLKAAQPGN